MLTLYIVRVNWEKSCPKVSKKPVFERLCGQSWSQSSTGHVAADWVAVLQSSLGRPSAAWAGPFAFMAPNSELLKKITAIALKSPLQTVIFLSFDLKVLNWLQFLLCLQIRIQALSHLLVFLWIVPLVLWQLSAALVVAFLQGICAVPAMTGPDIQSLASSSCLRGDESEILPSSCSLDAKSFKEACVSDVRAPLLPAH